MRKRPHSEAGAERVAPAALVGPGPDQQQFGGAWAKLARAREHRAVLDDAVARWLASKPISLRTEPEGPANHYVVRLDGAPRIPLRLSAIVGDVIHNLRSALDHLVYRMAIIEAGKSPPPKPTKLAFPIALSAPEYERKAATCRGGLSDEAWEALRAFQPFVTHAANPRLSSLAFIEELDVTDKHREFRLMPTQLGKVLKIAPTGPGVGITGVVAPGVLEPNDGLIWFESPSPDIGLDFDPELALAFADPEIFPTGRAVTEVLDLVIGDVAKVVGAFRTSRSGSGPEA